MDSPFSAQAVASQDPLAETSAWAKKIDAAKEILLRQVSSLRAQDVAVIQFTKSAQKIFHGTRDALLRDPSMVTSLEANGGTSIAAALYAVTTDQAFEPYRSLSVLILTDGQSDLDEATRAANDLVAKYPYARIDAIMIDETDQGRAVVEAVSINGTVRNATSTIQLGAAVSGARVGTLRAELQNMPLARFAAQEELSRLQELPAPTLIQVTSGEMLSGQSLRDAIAPTMQALENLEVAESIIRRRQPRGAVSSISQDSPISVNLSGLKESAELFLEWVVPSRRRFAEEMRQLEIQRRRLENEKQELDLRMRRLEIEKQEDDNKMHIDERRFALAKAQYELEKSAYELQKSKLELAQSILQQMHPDHQLRGDAREEAFRHILSAIDHGFATQLEFEVVQTRVAH
jgi:hypothetical protein